MKIGDLLRCWRPCDLERSWQTYPGMAVHDAEVIWVSSLEVEPMYTQQWRIVLLS